MSEKDTKEFRFGNDKFGGRYSPGELQLNLPEELSYDEFEEMFKERIGSLYKLGREIIPFEEVDVDSKKEKLKPLSIRVKAHTKEFFKNNSILSAREVLELYENYNHGSEAFINSLLKDEKDLEQELSEIQERLHNARLFKDKLNNMDFNNSVNDEEFISSLKEEYENSEVKVISEGDSDEVISDIQLYNTQKIVLNDNYFEIIAVNDVIPVIYYFASELAEDDLIKVLSDVKSYCSNNTIEFVDADESSDDEADGDEDSADKTEKDDGEE